MFYHQLNNNAVVWGADFIWNDIKLGMSDINNESILIRATIKRIKLGIWEQITLTFC